MEIKLMAIDLAKRSFQLHGVNEFGQPVLRTKVTRKKLLEIMVNLSPCKVVMEACGSSSYWARTFRKMGHEPLLIAPQFVKPFVKSNKNDANDAEAISEAAQRPSMRFVPVKEVHQQDVQALHRVRSRIIVQRVAVTNEIHGLLGEYGICISKSKKEILEKTIIFLSPEYEEITPLFKKSLQLLRDQLVSLIDQEKELNKEIKKLAEEIDVCKRLTSIPGVGPLIATAFYSTIVDPQRFSSSRSMSAYLGLVPRQHSTGGKSKLLGISKRGNSYLRTLLVHGSRALLIWKDKLSPRLREWVSSKLEERGWNKTCVALANKTARIAWVIMTRGESYQIM